MAFVKIMLNAAALDILRDKPRVRVRVKDGCVQFLPTDRKTDLNLPKGERLIPVTKTNRIAHFSVKEDILQPNNQVYIRLENYGWCSIVQNVNDHGKDQKGLLTAKLVLAAPNSTKNAKNAAKPFEDQSRHVNLAT